DYHQPYSIGWQFMRPGATPTIELNKYPQLFEFYAHEVQVFNDWLYVHNASMIQSPIYPMAGSYDVVDGFFGDIYAFDIPAMPDHIVDICKRGLPAMTWERQIQRDNTTHWGKPDLVMMSTP